MNDKTISESLGIKDGELVPSSDRVPAIKSVQGNDDYEFSRENLREIIDQGMGSLENLIRIAEQSEHPRAFEVVATLMKALSDANKDLMDLQRKQQIINKHNGESGLASPTTVNNNLWVGSTATLQKMLKAIKNDDE